MDDEAMGPLPSGEPDLQPAAWDRMVDSNAEWVWAAVGKDRDLFLLVWLRLADRWQADEGGPAEVLLRDVLAGVSRGASAPEQPPGSDRLSASGG